MHSRRLTDLAYSRTFRKKMNFKMMSEGRQKVVASRNVEVDVDWNDDYR